MKLILLLALVTWVFPTPVQAKTKPSLPEAKIETKQVINKEPYGPVPIPQKPVSAIQDQPTKTKSAGVSHRRNNPPKENKTVAKPADIQNSVRQYSKEEVIQLIISYSNEYGIAADAPLCIAKLESGYNQSSRNKSSSASGVFQYLSSTWRSTDEGRSGLSVFDADANVKAAIKYMASRKNAKPWTVHPKCPPVTMK